MVVAKIRPQWRMSFFLLLSTGFLLALWVSWATTIWATQNHDKSSWVSCQKDPFQLGIWGGAAYQQANNILDHCSRAVKWRPPDHPILRTDLIRRVIFWVCACVDQLPKWWRANNVNLKASQRMKTSSKLCIERDTYTKTFFLIYGTHTLKNNQKQLAVSKTACWHFGVCRLLIPK